MQTDTVALLDPNPFVEPLMAWLVPLTPQARAAIGGRPDFPIRAFPFKVGRESRLTKIARLKDHVDRRIGHKMPVNDLYLVEPADRALHISREHFVIHASEDRYVVNDRGSACGTIVGGTRIGADAPITAAIIRPGDVITVGTEASPYIFRFDVQPAFHGETR